MSQFICQAPRSDSFWFSILLLAALVVLTTMAMLTKNCGQFNRSLLHWRAVIGMAAGAIMGYYFGNQPIESVKQERDEARRTASTTEARLEELKEKAAHWESETTKLESRLASAAAAQGHDQCASTLDTAQKELEAKKVELGEQVALNKKLSTEVDQLKSEQGQNRPTETTGAGNSIDLVLLERVEGSYMRCLTELQACQVGSTVVASR